MTRTDQKKLRQKICKDFRKGMSYKELYEKYPAIGQSTIRRWVRAIEQEKTDQKVQAEVRAINNILNVTDIIETKEKAEEIKDLSYDLDELSPTSNGFKAYTLGIAESRYRAGLDFQLATAVWMTQCRYQLAVTSTSVQGTVKIEKVPVLPENIDFKKRVVHFDGQVYDLSCLIPDTKSAKLGLEMLMKLTGTDQATSEEVKSKAKEAAIEAEIAREGDVTGNSKIAITMSRPQRKTLEEVIQEQKNEQIKHGEGTE